MEQLSNSNPNLTNPQGASSAVYKVSNLNDEKKKKAKKKEINKLTFTQGI